MLIYLHLKWIKFKNKFCILSSSGIFYYFFLIILCVILFCLPCTTFPFHVLSFITLLPIRSLVFQQIYWCPTSVHDFSLPYELQVYKYISFSHIPIIIFPQALSNIIQSILTPPRQPRKWRISVFCVWAIFRHNQTDILQVTNSSWILS